MRYILPFFFVCLEKNFAHPKKTISYSGKIYHVSEEILSADKRKSIS